MRPNNDPVINKSKLASKAVVNWTIPIANINPGMPYPIVRRELSELKSLLLLNRIEKLTINASIAHKIAAEIDIIIVFKAVWKNFSLKNAVL